MSRTLIFTIFLCLKSTADAYTFPLSSQANHAWEYVIAQSKKLCSLSACWFWYSTPEPVELSYMESALVWIGWSEKPKYDDVDQSIVCGGYVFTISAILFIIYLTLSRNYFGVSKKESTAVLLPFLAENEDFDEGEYEMEMYDGGAPKTCCTCDVCINEAGDMKNDDSST